MRKVSDLVKKAAALLNTSVSARRKAGLGVQTHALPTRITHKMSRQETYGVRQGPAPTNLQGDSTAIKAAEPETLEEIRKGGGAQVVTFQAVLPQSQATQDCCEWLRW